MTTPMRLLLVRPRRNLRRRVVRRPHHPLERRFKKRISPPLPLRRPQLLHLQQVLSLQQTLPPRHQLLQSPKMYPLRSPFRTSRPPLPSTKMVMSLSSSLPAPTPTSYPEKRRKASRPALYSPQVRLAVSLFGPLIFNPHTLREAAVRSHLRIILRKMRLLQRTKKEKALKESNTTALQSQKWTLRTRTTRKSG